MLSKFFIQWDHFWYRTVPPHALALFRIAFAAYLIIEALTYYFQTPALFSDRALTFSLLDLGRSSATPLRPPPVFVAWVIATVYLIACLGLLTGWWMRCSLIILILLTLYYWQLSFFLFPSSYHRIYFFTLCTLLVSGADKTFSLRMLRSHGSIYAWEPISVFAQHLLLVQISMTYIGVGIQKAWLPSWQDGTVLKMSLLGRWGTPIGRWVVSLDLPLWFYTACVEVMKVCEVLLPFMLLSKTFRWLGVTFGILFHGGIAILMSIWWFLPLVPAYIVFWKPEEIYAFCKAKSAGKIA